MAWMTPLQEPMIARSPATAGEENTQPPVSYCHSMLPRMEAGVGGRCSGAAIHGQREVARPRMPGRTSRESPLTVHLLSGPHLSIREADMRSRTPAIQPYA